MIKLHLLTNGFLSTYKRWYYHGELVADLKNETTFDSQVNNVEEEYNDLASGLKDAIGSEYFDIGPTGNFDDNSSFNVSDKYNVIFESLHKPLYDNYKDYILKTVVKLINIKVLNKLTDKAFDDILKCFKDILPEADEMAWKHFYNIYLHFAIDSRSVQMGLASDGFNPFSNLSSSYNLWHVILIPYSMPPWASPNGTNYLMSLLIPGPKSPGKDYDVFLQPLIKELKKLRHGIDAYDSYGRRIFKLKAAVLGIINDFPAYAYLSGWKHRCYLSANHSWRRSKDYDGSSELRGPPRTFTCEDILKQLEEVHVRTPGKAPKNSSRKCKRGANELNWSKRSILFDLPYWSTLLLQNNLDVMHIEKNVCDNTVGTLLDIEGK
ncbi:uncharacterized protein LOC141705714 [Apium graveolens]|uniref:uncharacterized protein LOC141705713 n=1 Tax=Apium graveolens TaxID=4045 RepID=UPI003D7A2D12